MIHPSSLSWSEVDPARIPFDPSDVERVARSAVPQGPPGDELRQAFQDALDEAFCAAFGPWAGGWLWGRGESELDGGPGDWCCPGHCVLLPGEPLEPTLERAAEALRAWRRHLERVAEVFRSLPRPAEPGHLEESALELAALAVEVTACESGWYSYAATLLAWYLQFLGAPPERAREAADRALAGRFESWSSPGEEVLREVGRDFGTLALAALE